MLYKKQLPVISALLTVGTGMAPQPSRRLRLAYVHQPWVKRAVGEAGRHLGRLEGGAAGVEDPAGRNDRCGMGVRAAVMGTMVVCAKDAHLP